LLKHNLRRWRLQTLIEITSKDRYVNRELVESRQETRVEEGGRRSCRRLALYEARISRHEIAATRENLRGLIMDRGRVDSQDELGTGRKRERENRCVTSGGQYFRAARMRPLSRYFSLKQIVGQTAPLHTSTRIEPRPRNLVQPRTPHFSQPVPVAMPIKTLRNLNRREHSMDDKRTPQNYLLIQLQHSADSTNTV